MTHPPKAPASDTTPEPSALEKLERMRDLTRRIVRVPKSDLPKTTPKKRRKR
jgi:hypothetical protein